MLIIKELDCKFVVKNGLASSKETPCFLWFTTDLMGSHSNQIINTVYCRKLQGQERLKARA